MEVIDVGVETIEQKVKESCEEIDEESQFLDSLYYDVVSARSYSLLLENIARHNRPEINCYELKKESE